MTKQRGLCQRCSVRPAVNTIEGVEMCGLCTADATGGSAGDLRIGRRYSGDANNDAASAWSGFAEKTATGGGERRGLTITGGKGITVSGSAIGDGNTVINHGDGDRIDNVSPGRLQRLFSEASRRAASRGTVRQPQATDARFKRGRDVWDGDGYAWTSNDGTTFIPAKDRGDAGQQRTSD